MYEISSLGRVRTARNIYYRNSATMRTPAHKVLRSFQNHLGRWLFPFRVPSRKFQRHFAIHRLVALAFIPNPSNLPDINHKDGNPSNNNASNLEWVTHRQNMAHAAAMGLVAKGARNGNAKLTAAKVKRILRDALTMTHDAVAIRYGLGRITVSNIVRGKHWKHVARPANYDQQRQHARRAKRRNGVTVKECKWTPELVHELRATYQGKRGERKAWAERVGVSPASVACVIARKTFVDW